MSDKFMASLLSENSNESFSQSKNYNMENELHKELSFNGLIPSENDVNIITTDGHTSDLVNSTDITTETGTSDKNGNYNDSAEVNKNDKEEKSLSPNATVSAVEKGLDETCNDQTGVELNATKEATVINRVDIELNTLNASSSFKATDTKMDSKANSQKYRDDLESSDDDTSTFSFDSSSGCSDSFFDKMRRSCSPAAKIPNIKTKGELDLDELPPIEDLSIDVTEREMQKVGSIYAIVDKLVIVRALKDLRPLDLDSVLFISYKNPLGRIFDVFGPVVEPFYSVRFNSPQHIADKSIAIDADVFFAPEKTDITTYVFVEQLKKQKGSDASWQDNNEPPEEHLDYSDDDEERAAKRKRQAKNRTRQLDLDLEDDDDVQVIPKKVSRDSKPKDFEKIHPWVDIQRYKQSVSEQPRPSNPFRTPYSNPSSRGSSPSGYANSRVAAERYPSSASQGGANVPQRSAMQQSFAVPQQPMPQPSVSYPFRFTAQHQSPAAQSPVFFSPPHMSPHPIQSQSPLPLLQPQSPLPSSPHQSPLQPGLPFMYQRQPFVLHPGMSPNPIFGQVPYFNQSPQSPMGVPPPPASSPLAFPFRQEVGNYNSNFMNQPPNFTSQASQFMNQPASIASQTSNFGIQNSGMAQAPAGSQWQQGPPSPYGISPLSISIPNTPPPNAIQMPVQSPYNVWGSNFPQSGYFGNMQ